MQRPNWVEQIALNIQNHDVSVYSRFAVPSNLDARESAVLILFGETQGVPDVVVIQRSSSMKQHAGQPAFPGGAVDDGETPEQTALREAREEVGLDIDSVDIIGRLPKLWVPVSGYAVTPVVAWWHSPHEISVVDAAEVARVERISIAELVDPNNRVRIRHSSGYIGPAFLARGMTIWGFTGGLMNGLFEILGYATPWDQSNVIDLGE